MKTTLAFLLSLLLLPIAAHAQPAADATAADIQAGQTLALDRSKGNCIACHTMKGGDVASTVGPELAGMKTRFPDRADLVAILDNEEARNPQTMMPLFGRNRILTKAEIERVVDYLNTL